MGEAPSSPAPPTPHLVGGEDELKTQAAQREINQFSSEQSPQHHPDKSIYFSIMESLKLQPSHRETQRSPHKEDRKVIEYPNMNFNYPPSRAH